MQQPFSAYELGKIALTSNDSTSVRTTSLEADILEIFNLYREEQQIDFLPVVDATNSIVGYLRRQMFLAALSQNQYARELLLRPGIPISSMMDRRVISLDAHTNLSEASRQLMARDDEIRFDPFVITLDGGFFGISTVRRVLDGLNYYFELDLESCATAQRRLLDCELHQQQRHEESFRASWHVEGLKGPGGDFAAVYDLNSNLKLLLLFDVCGKGLKAANMVMAIGSAIRSYVEFAGEAQNLRELGMRQTLRRLNRLIYEQTPEEMYATGVVMVIDKREMLLELFDYGHGFIWLKRLNSCYNISPLQQPTRLKSTARQELIPFFGINVDFNLKPLYYRLKPDDTLLTCSDGVIECCSVQKEEYSEKRLVEALTRYNGNDPDELVETIRTDLEEHRNGYRRSDDLSIMALQL